MSPEQDSSYSQDAYEETLNRAAGSAFPEHLIVSEEEAQEAKAGGVGSDAVPQDGNLGHEPEEEPPTEQDRLDRETAWHHLANPMKPLTARHREVVRRLAKGDAPWEIRRDMGWSAAYLSILSSHPKIRAEVDRIQADILETTNDRLASLNSRAIDVVQETIMDPDSKERLRAATWLLEKTTGKAKQEIETKGGSLTDFMTLLRQFEGERQKLQGRLSEGEARGSKGNEIIDITPSREGEKDALELWVDQNL